MSRKSSITKEWDAIAQERLHDLLEGKDKSYNDILKPNVLKAMQGHKTDRVLDAGCGVGVLTKEIAAFCQEIVGIDISPVSIRLAKRYCQLPNIRYQHTSIESYQDNKRFSTILSNMVLMDVPDIKPIATKVFSLLQERGSFIITVTHPAFWPLYWGYATDHDFLYNKQHEIIREFSIRGKRYNGLYTRHFHRPIGEYINTIIDSGFKIDKFTELSDDNSVAQWYPRFMMLECTKSN